MNDIEKNHLERFLAEKDQVDVVKKVILEMVDFNKLVAEKGYMEGVSLYELVRGYQLGREIIEQGFKELQKYKKVDQNKKSNVNNAV